MTELKDNICVSVIIPVFNVEEYLCECINSIINQSLKEIEVIFVDDGSTDHSVNIINNYHDSRFVLLRQCNSGPGKARNNGILHAKGEFVIFMDPDDYYIDSNALEYLYRTAVQKKVRICGGNIVNVLPDGNVSAGPCSFTKDGYLEFQEFQDCSYHQRYLIERSMLIEQNIFYPDYRRYQDPPFLLKVMLCAKKLYVLSRDIYGYRINNSVKKYDLCKVKDMMYGIADVLRISSENNLKELHKKCWHSIFTFYWKYIYYYIFQGDEEIGKAAELLDCAINVNMLEMTSQEALLLNSYNYDTYKEKYDLQRKLIDVIQSEIPIIIYGAGTIGNKVLNYVENICNRKIMGIAVTEIENENDSNIRIRKIDDYLENRDSVNVIVAVSDKYQKEITDYLSNLKFKNVLSVRDIYFDMI